MGKTSVIGRRIATTIGMLSILLFSVLLPFQAASCALFGASGEYVPQILCKADLGSGHSRLVAPPDELAPERPDCATCLGLAGLTLIFVTATVLGLALRRSAQAFPLPGALCLHGVEGFLRPSRAPPLAA